MWEKRSHPGIEPELSGLAARCLTIQSWANSVCVMGLDSNQTSNRTQFTLENPIKNPISPYDFDLLMKIVWFIVIARLYLNTFQLLCF